MNKLVVAVIIGMLFFTACDEGTNNDGNETALKTPAQTQYNIINLSNMNISSIKIKELNTGQDSILIKDSIIWEFCEFLNGLKFTKTDEPPISEYEAEIFDGGELVLKISFWGSVVSFSEKVMIGNSVIESGYYELENWVTENIKHFYEGRVLDPQYIELPASIYLPECEFELEIVDRGSTKVNQQEVYSQLYEFVKENFCNNKFEIVEYKRVDDYELMEQQKQNARKNSRAITIQNIGGYGGYIEVDSDNGYDEFISGGNIVLSECVQKPQIFQLYLDSSIIDIKADSEFARGFKYVFDTNAKESKNLTPDEIEVLFNEKTPYYMDYICNNLGIESWRWREPNRLEKHKKSLNSEDEPYTVLEFYNDFNLRLLFFKEDKFIDYIDYGHRSAGTEYRLEKVGDKIFIVGRRCRNHGTGVERNFEEWYTLSDEGKKLVISFPYLDFIQPPYRGYELTANNIKLNTGEDMSIVVDYNVRKFYMLDMDIDDEYGQVTIEGTKRVVFKWDDEKSAFVSEYGQNEMGMVEIPAESDDITEKSTELLKNKYQQLTEIMISFPEEIYRFNKENIKDLWQNFLNDCKDCDEKIALLEMLKKKQYVIIQP